MSIIKCPECGREISNLAESCINCGYPIKKNAEKNLQAGLCKACGSKNEADAMYCKDCGMKLQGYSSMGVYSRYKQEIIPEPEKPWKTVITFLGCIFFPFIGTILMWVWKKPRSKAKRIGFTVLCVMYGFLLYFYRTFEEAKVQTNVVETVSEVESNDAIGEGNSGIIQEYKDLSEQVSVEEHSFENAIGATYYILVIKNNSDKTIQIDVNAIAKDGDGKVIGATDSSENAIASDTEACLLNYFDDVKNAADFEYTLVAEEDKYYESVTQDLVVEQSVTDKKVVLTCTNNGKKAAEFVEAYGLFFLNGEIVYYDSTYITDSDFEIKPGETLSKELNCYKEFDEVKIYCSGRR